MDELGKSLSVLSFGQGEDPSSISSMNKGLSFLAKVVEVDHNVDGCIPLARHSEENPFQAEGRLKVALLDLFFSSLKEDLVSQKTYHPLYVILSVLKN